MKKAAIVALVKDNKVLMQKRDDKKGVISPGCWSLPGGIVEKDESVKSAVIREFKEETGYVLKNPKLITTHIYFVEGEKIKGHVFY